MKFIVRIQDTSIVLTPEQVNAIAEMLETAEVLDNKYMGTGLGTNGTNYMEVLAPVVVKDVLRPGVMTDTHHEALTFITKQLADAAKK